MSTNSVHILVRPAKLADVSELCHLLNTIIRIGGTTAFEVSLTPADFAEYFLTGRHFINCFAAEDEKTGRLCGFQALEQNPELPENWCDIATFAQVEPKIPGIGTALFAATRLRSQELGLSAINATIRADNVGGLVYYEKMGFENYKTTKAVPLKDGTPVDRISKRYFLI